MCRIDSGRPLQGFGGLSVACPGCFVVLILYKFYTLIYFLILNNSYIKNKNIQNI